MTCKPLGKPLAACLLVALAVGACGADSEVAASTEQVIVAATAPAAAPAADSSAPGADSVGAAGEDSLRSDSLAQARETEVQRETFVYSGGVRDPFASLMKDDKSGIELVDLQLVGVYQDLGGGGANTVAVIKEKVSGKRHKLRVGDQIGRMRVAGIQSKDVVFAISDFGYERKETLSLRKQEDLTP